MNQTRRTNNTTYRTLQTALSIGIGSGLFVALFLVQMPGTIAHAQMANIVSNTEPIISSISMMPSDTATTIDWTTDEPSTSQIMYGTSLSYGSYSNLDTNDVTAHSEILTGLIPDTLYYFQIVDTNISGNTNASSGQTLTTISSGEIATTSTSMAAPIISTIAVRPSIADATITWDTDQLSNSQVLFGMTSLYGASTTLDKNEVTNHSEMLTGLLPDTTYYFQLVDEGMSSGLTSTSTNDMFTTLSNSGPVIAPPTTLTFQEFENAIAQLQQEIGNLQ